MDVRPTGKLWAGDSTNAAIARSQTDDSIACSEPTFDNYVCMTYDDYIAWRLSCPSR